MSFLLYTVSRFLTDTYFFNVMLYFMRELFCSEIWMLMLLKKDEARKLCKIVSKRRDIPSRRMSAANERASIFSDTWVNRALARFRLVSGIYYIFYFPIFLTVEKNFSACYIFFLVTNWRGNIFFGTEANLKGLPLTSKATRVSVGKVFGTG